MAEGKRVPNIHKGHRERVRSKYLRVGFDGFSDHEVLEFLLFYCNAQQDTNEIAHRLINTFGTLDAVFNASVEDLMKIKGIGDRSALLIKFIADLMNSQLSGFDSRRPLDSSDEMAAHMLPLLESLRVETTFIMALDEERKLIRVIKVGEGSFDSTPISIPQVTRVLVSCGAASAVIFHNHPAGTALPSVNDIRITKQVQLALESVGIEFIDHIIYSNKDRDYISMRDSGDRLYTIAQSR